METLARLGVATIELLEAEGRNLRKHLVRLAIAAGFGVFLMVLALTGFGFLVFGLYLLLAQYMAPSYAAMVVGGAGIVLSVAGATAIMQKLGENP